MSVGLAVQSSFSFSIKKDSVPSSKPKKSRIGSVDCRNSGLAVDQIQSLSQIEHTDPWDEATDGDGSRPQYLWMDAYKALAS